MIQMRRLMEKAKMAIDTFHARLTDHVIDKAQDFEKITRNIIRPVKNIDNHEPLSPLSLKPSRTAIPYLLKT